MSTSEHTKPRNHFRDGKLNSLCVHVPENDRSAVVLAAFTELNCSSKGFPAHAGKVENFSSIAQHELLKAKAQ